MSQSENETYTVKTMYEMRLKAHNGEVKKGTVCYCEELQGSYMYEGNESWVCVKTKQKGYENLYGHGTEQ